MKTILFQGDSITDAGRSREVDQNLGVGYPNLVSAQLAFENPGKYNFYNRGISGNRIVDIYARIKRDIINLKPDIMSILVGINDVWHEVDFGGKNGVDADKFYKIYDMLIEEIKAELPDIKIIIMSPYVLKTERTEPDWDYFETEVVKRAEAAKRIAQKYNLPFVDLQAEFDKAIEKADALYWTYEGIHPTYAGHEIIKRQWLKAFETLDK